MYNYIFCNIQTRRVFLLFLIIKIFLYSNKYNSGNNYGHRKYITMCSIFPEYPNVFKRNKDNVSFYLLRYKGNRCILHLTNVLSLN